MSKLKEARAKFLFAYKSVYKKVSGLVDTNCDNVRLLNKGKEDLETAWVRLYDSHFEYLTKEKNEEDINAVTEEYDALDTKNDEVLIKISERLEILNATEGDPVETEPKLTNKQQSEVEVNTAIGLKEAILHTVTSISEALNSDTLNISSINAFVRQVDNLRGDIDKIWQSFITAMNLNPDEFVNLSEQSSTTVAQTLKEIQTLDVRLSSVMPVHHPPPTSSLSSPSTRTRPTPTTYKE